MDNPIQAPRTDLIIAVPTRGRVRTEWAAMLASLSMPVNTSHMLRIIPGRSVEEARNVAVQAARDAEAKYLLFIDDDVLVPNQAIRRMVWKMENEQEWDVLTGIVPIKSDPPEPCVFREGESVGPYWGWTFGEFFEVTACGMACAMIRMSAFDKIQPPYFEWVRQQNGKDRAETGEDIGFCRKLVAAGGRILADGGLLCGHTTLEGKVHQLDVDTAPFHRAGAEALSKYTILEPA